MDFRRIGRIGAPVALVLAGAGAAAVFAYDASRDDRIADGATAAGVDIGGIDRDDARRRIERVLSAAVERPLTAVHRGRRFRLSASRAGLRLDAERMVDEAIRQSREGNAVTRTFRDLAGTEPEVEVPIRVTWSRASVRRFVRRIERAVGRPARNADIGFAGGRLHRVRARNGLEVRSAELLRAVERALGDPAAGRRRVRVPTRVDERPDVTLAEFRRRYPRVITIDTRRKRLRFYRRLRHVVTSEIAIGQQGFSTERGRYEITRKIVNPPWHAPDKEGAGEFAGETVPPGDPNNPLKARWMEFHQGQGIHGTDDVASLGRRASHGCIRMAIPDVKRLYRRVRVGTPVFID